MPTLEEEVSGLITATNNLISEVSVKKAVLDTAHTESVDSAAAALASENAAATSEANASTSETNAAASESSAGTSAANALASEQASAASETNTIAYWENISDQVTEPLIEMAANMIQTQNIVAQHHAFN